MPNQDVEEAVGRADVVWVGGGSVANLLAVWRLHGVDDAMRAAWERGAVLAGVSAGSICWHVGGPTDSYGPTLQLEKPALGLIPYGNGVHYDSEEQRRPLLHSLVADGSLPTSYATDDRVGILYEGTEPVAVVTDHDVDPVDRAGGLPRRAHRRRCRRDPARARRDRLIPSPLRPHRTTHHDEPRPRGPACATCRSPCSPTSPSPRIGVGAMPLSDRRADGAGHGPRRGDRRAARGVRRSA